jgi:hypothetical protein
MYVLNSFVFLIIGIRLVKVLKNITITIAFKRGDKGKKATSSITAISTFARNVIIVFNEFLVRIS